MQEYARESTGLAILEALGASGGSLPEWINPHELYMREGTAQKILEAAQQGGGGGSGWSRPEGWPNLDALAAGIPTGTDCVYMTYTVLGQPNDFLSITAATSGGEAWTLERGTVVDGAFVAEESFSVNSGNNVAKTLNVANGAVQLWRGCSTAFSSFAFAGDGNFGEKLQPCGEISGRVSFNGGMNLSKYLQRFSMSQKLQNNTLNLQRFFKECVSLRSIDFSGWDLSAVSGDVQLKMLEAFNQCAQLESVDLTTFSSLTITSADYLQSAFQQCYSLRVIDVRPLHFENLVTLSGGGLNFITNVGATVSILGTNTLTVAKSKAVTITPAYSLVEFDGLPQETRTDISGINNCDVLSHQSLLNIIDCLADVETTKTLNIGSTNLKKLTAEEIAVATEKGWTLT